MGISILIPYWNSRRHAEAHLPSVFEAVAKLKQPWEVLVIDDGSTDSLAQWVPAHFREARVIRRERNEGFSAAMRQGVDAAKHDILYFLNSDVRVEPEVFEAVLGHFADGRVCAVESLDVERKPFSVAVVTNHWGLLGVRYLNVAEPQGPIPLLFATGGHSAYRAAAFRELGGYDELFAPAYWEDIDFGVRAQSKGWKILLEPRSRVHHQPRGTMARRYSPAQIEALRASHRWYFTKRHAPHPSLKAWMALALSHGVLACPPFSTGPQQPKPIASQASASEAILQRFRASAVKSANQMPWRVAFISATGAFAGGGEVSLSTLIQALDKRWVEPIVVCPSEGPLTTQLRSHQVDVHELPCPPTVKGLLGGALRRFIGWLRTHDIDILHVNSAGRTLSLWGLAGKLLGIPVVWHVRVATKDWMMDPLAVSLSDKLVVTSAFVASRFTSRRAQLKMRRIANPVDLELFSRSNGSSSWRAQQGLGSAICVGSFGRFDAWKRFDLSLHAVAQARWQEPRLHLVMVGDGPLRPKLEELSRRLGLGSAISFTGWSYQAPQLMTQMDVILHPAPTEHFGRIFIEAMASAKPVVAPRAAGAAELITHEQTGLLTASADAALFAQALVRLARDEPLRRQMGQAARQRARMFYASGPIAQQVLGVYKELLKA